MERSAFDLLNRIDNNPGVVLRKRLAAALLFLALAAMPQLLWLGAHSIVHHEHAEEAPEHGVEWSSLAEALIHGHGHKEGIPEHEHRLLPSPVFRPDLPHDFDAPATASLAAPDAGQLSLAGAASWQCGTRLGDSIPPRLRLLCTLLI